MALHCPFCNSTDTHTLIGDNTQCVNCGAMFNSDGDRVSGIDAGTREVLEKALEPRQTNIVGNLADLQRAGAETLTGDEVTTTKAEPAAKPKAAAAEK